MMLLDVYVKTWCPTLTASKLKSINARCNFEFYSPEAKAVMRTFMFIRFEK